MTQHKPLQHTDNT